MLWVRGGVSPGDSLYTMPKVEIDSSSFSSSLVPTSFKFTCMKQVGDLLLRVLIQKDDWSVRMALLAAAVFVVLAVARKKKEQKKTQSNNGRQAPTALLSELSVLAVWDVARAQTIETPAEMELPGSTRSQPPIDMTNLEVRFDAMCLRLWDRFRWHHWKVLGVYTYLIVSWTQTGFMLFNCTPSKATVAFECTRFVRAYILFSRNPILAELKRWFSH